MKDNVWWHMYGSFRQGVNGLPHMGDVIGHYRRVNGLSIAQVAEAYGCTDKRIWQLEGPQNMDQPINPSKRRVLAGTLGIPAVLLGLSPLTSSTKRPSWSDEHELLCEDLLSTSWHIFYTGDFQATTRNIASWLYLLEHSVTSARGIDKANIQTMWVRYLQLSTAILRDRENEEAALSEATKAITLSRELGSTELLVGSLHQRFRVYEQLEDYQQARADTDEMIRLVKVGGVSNSLAGTAHVSAGEAYTNLAKSDYSLRSKTLHLYDQAAHIARTLKPDNTESPMIRFGLSRVMTERALAMRYFGQPKGAVQDLEVAKASLPRNNKLWLRDITLTEADIKSVEGDFRGALTLTQAALQTHLETSSQADYFWMRRIVRRVLAKEPRNTEAQRLLLSL